MNQQSIQFPPRYVAGLLFENHRPRVLLVRKERPSWQLGLWNAIGGKIEHGETPLQAMVREFEEEAGLRIEYWKPFALLHDRRGYHVQFYAANHHNLDEARTLTDEKVEAHWLADVPTTVANINWLIQLAQSALDSPTQDFYEIWESEDSAEQTPAVPHLPAQTLAAMEWIFSRDTGVSSKTIWSVLMGVDYEGADIPYDNSDFGRCYRLLQRFPQWRERLPEVAARYPKWGPLVREWDKLTVLYQQDQCSRELYDLLHSLRDECMRADGWVRTGSHSWKKPSL